MCFCFVVLKNILIFAHHNVMDAYEKGDITNNNTNKKNYKTMKTKLFYFVAIVVGMMCCTTVSAQDDKQMLKEQNAIMKQATKDAKKQAKELKKDGWKVAVGATPMEKQLEELFVKERGGKAGLPQYIIGRSEAVSGSYAAARKIAVARAREEVAGTINTKVAGILESTLTNVQTSSVDVATVQKDVSTAKQLIDQTLDKADVIFEVYREVNNNTQFQIGVAFADSKAKEILKLSMSGASAEAKAKAEEQW